ERAAVERDLGDAGLPGPLGQQRADLLRDVCLAHARDRGADLLLDRGRRGERVAARVVDQLARDVLQAAEHRQPRPRSVLADPVAHAGGLRLAALVFPGRGRHDSASAAASAGVSGRVRMRDQAVLPEANALPAFRRTISPLYLMPLPL